MFPPLPLNGNAPNPTFISSLISSATHPTLYPFLFFWIKLFILSCCSLHRQLRVSACQSGMLHNGFHLFSVSEPPRSKWASRARKGKQHIQFFANCFSLTVQRLTSLIHLRRTNTNKNKELGQRDGLRNCTKGNNTLMFFMWLLCLQCNVKQVNK